MRSYLKFNKLKKNALFSVFWALCIFGIGKDEDRLDRGNAPLGAKESGAKGSTLHTYVGTVKVSNCSAIPQKGTKTMSTKIGTCKITSLLAAPSYLYSLSSASSIIVSKKFSATDWKASPFTYTLCCVWCEKKCSCSIFYYLELTKVKKNYEGFHIPKIC